MLVGFKQGSGKIIFAFQITQASGMEDGFAGGKTVGRETQEEEEEAGGT